MGINKQLKPRYRNYCVYRLFIIFFLNVVKNERLRRMSNTLLLGLSLCGMVARVFPTEDSVQTNGTKGPMETIVIQRELNWGNMESRLANVESRLANVESRLANVESGIADLKSLILKLVGSENGVNASQPVGGSKGDNVVEDKDNVAAVRRDCTNAEDCFSVFEERKTWEDARRSCQALGGDLATLSSVAETRSLQKYLTKIRISTSTGTLWVGAKKGKTDGKNLGNWKWITGEPVPTDGTVGQVARDEPAGCLVIHDEESALGNFHDFWVNPCYRKKPYVCSKTK